MLQRCRAVPATQHRILKLIAHEPTSEEGLMTTGPSPTGRPAAGVATAPYGFPRPPLSRRSFLHGVLGAGALAAGGSLLSACSGSGGSISGSKPTSLASSSANSSTAGEITIWDRSGDLFKVFDGAIASFNQSYPNIKVHHVQVDIDAKLPNALITGAGLPDGSFWDDAKIPSQYEHLTDLSQLIKPYTADTVQYKLDVNTVNGKIYGVPWDLDPGLLYYRADLLEQAGVDPAGITTYDKLLEAAATVKSKVSSATGPIHLDKSPFLGQLWLEMLSNQLNTSMADANGKLRLDSDAYRTIFNWIQKAVSQKLVTHTTYLDPTDLKLLDNGTQVFVPWAIWWDAAPQQLLKTSKGKWRAMQLPAWTEGGSRSGVMGGSSFLIPAKAKNPELAWLFYEHLVYKKEGYTKVYGANSVYPGGLNTSIPSYKPALDPSVPLFKPFPELGNQDLWSVAVKAGTNVPGGTPLPSWWAGAVDYLGNNLQKLIEGSMTPEQVISTSTAAINKNLVNR
jgi:lactose/L-arabinose transport system substrate-binding protein